MLATRRVFLLVCVLVAGVLAVALIRTDWYAWGESQLPKFPEKQAITPFEVHSVVLSDQPLEVSGEHRIFRTTPESTSLHLTCEIAGIDGKQWQWPPGFGKGTKRSRGQASYQLPFLVPRVSLLSRSSLGGGVSVATRQHSDFSKPTKGTGVFELQLELPARDGAFLLVIELIEHPARGNVFSPTEIHHVFWCILQIDT